MKTVMKKCLGLLLAALMVVAIVPQMSIKAKAASGVEDFVKRCYTVALGRKADKTGLKDWTGKLNNGQMVGSVVAHEFIFSAEYKAMKKSDKQFIKDLYMLFMDRKPDSAGNDYWLGEIAKGASREDVFAGFANSAEFYGICSNYGITAGYYTSKYKVANVNNVNLFVDRLYKTTLGRGGDADGQKYWVTGLLEKKYTGAECAANFINSKEFTKKGLSNSKYIDVLYQGIMGRASDKAGKSYWLGELNDGKMTRDQVLEGFTKSDEFKNLCATYGITCGSYTATDVPKKASYVKLSSLESIGRKPKPAPKLVDNYGNKYTSAYYNYNTESGAKNGSFVHEYLVNGKYTTFSGTIYIPEGETSNGVTMLAIKGDGHTLYSSPVMTKTSKPIKINVNIAGVKKLNVMWGNNTAFSSYSSLKCCLADAKLQKAPTSTMAGVTLSKYPVDLYNYDSIEDTLYLTDYFVDNYDNLHMRGFDNGSGTNGKVYEFLLNKKYKKFTTTLYVPKTGNRKNDYVIFYVYADGKKIYTSPEITAASKPIKVNLDITGCNDLKITYSTGGYYFRLCAGDPYLYK